MSIGAYMETVRADIEPTREQLEARLREVHSGDYWVTKGVYEYGLSIGGSWRFFLNMFTDGDFRTSINRFAPYDDPLVWAVRGRRPLVQDEAAVYYNDPDYVAVIHRRIEATPASVIRSLVERERRILLESYLAEGMSRERAEGLVGPSGGEGSVWPDIAAFYARAHEDGHLVVCVIG